MGIMAAIKKGFGTATKGFGLVLVLFVMNLIFNLVSLPFTPKAGETPTPNQMTPAFLLSLVFILISIFIQGGALGLVRDYLKGGAMKLGNLASYGMKYYLRLLTLLLIVVLIILVAGVIAALLIAATAPLNNAVVTGIATIVAIIVGAIAIYYLILLVMAPYAIVCEEAKAIEGLKKSLGMVKRAIGKVLLLLVLLILISLGAGFIVGFISGIATVALPVAAGQIAIAIVSSAFNGYMGVMMMAAFMGLYLGLKEQEGSAQKVF